MTADMMPVPVAEWKREEAEKKGQGGMTSNKNLLGMGMKFLGKK